MVKRGPTTPAERTTERVGAGFGGKSDQTTSKKKKDGASRHGMASMMHICMGLMGPKSKY